jgi:hypothetical protein
MVFNATVYTISVISWQSVVLVEETGVSGENHRPAASHWQTDHIMLYQLHLAWAGFELTKLVVIGTDCVGTCSYKSNYHTIMTTMAPFF